MHAFRRTILVNNSFLLLLWDTNAGAENLNQSDVISTPLITINVPVL